MDNDATLELTEVDMQSLPKVPVAAPQTLQDASAQIDASDIAEAHVANIDKPVPADPVETRVYQLEHQLEFVMNSATSAFKVMQTRIEALEAQVSEHAKHSDFLSRLAKNFAGKV
jgi:hypothetical protein